jgi:ABC-type Na+ transport system ATPase subunit NatA
MSYRSQDARHLSGRETARSLLAMTAISVHDLHKSYDGTEAVRGVSFDVAAGEVFCLLGPNGAGKTTTVEILEGYRLADAGTVRVLGADPARGDRGLRDRLGIVLQAGGIQPELTVAEVLEMYGRWYERTRPVDELLELVELADERDVRVQTLSGGQQRRLDLALGLVGDPELLFLDEPTTGFDPGARRRAWSTIRSLCSLGKTVVLTTHYITGCRPRSASACPRRCACPICPASRETGRACSCARPSRSPSRTGSPDGRWKRASRWTASPSPSRRWKTSTWS